MPSSGMLHRVALVRTEVSEERIASIIMVTGISELGTLAVTSNRSTLQGNAVDCSPVRRFLRLRHGMAAGGQFRDRVVFVLQRIPRHTSSRTVKVFRGFLWSQSKC
jgi:hypothetical protein